jgi:cysteinyl-tRNA synthetase
MSFKIFNTMKRKKEAFVPKGPVKMYTCGPTVYNFAHIGNLRAYLFYDLLKRWLEFRRFEVKHVMNITDVDDKTIRDSQKAGLSLKVFTEKYTRAFFDDLAAIRIQPASIYPRATEHIQDMVEMIKLLMLRGYAYRGEDGSVYFRIDKFKPYGKLSKLKLKKLKAGARVSHDEYTKQEAQDFALWKAWQPEDGEVFWNTPLGKGRPGWHIECSVMSQKYLKRIDIHGGGVDLIFPHHENEIAQSEAANEEEFARYWVHSEHLMVDKKKMSKSLGNFYTLRDVVEKGHDPVAFRYLALASHYRSQLNFTFAALADAKNTVDRFNEFVRRVAWLQKEAGAEPNHELHTEIRKARELFEKSMDDDLNTPKALAAVFGLIKEVNTAIDSGKADRKTLQAVEKFMMQVNSIFDIIEAKNEESGILPKAETDDFVDKEKTKLLIEMNDFPTLESLRSSYAQLDEVPHFLKTIGLQHDVVPYLILIREAHRRHRNFAAADKIRAMLKEKGFLLEDTPQGVRWTREKK